MRQKPWNKIKCIKRFGDVVHCAQIKSVLPVFFRSASGDKNDGRGPHVGNSSETLMQLEAAKVGHGNVESNQIEYVRLSQSHGFLGAQSSFVGVRP